MYPGAGVTQEFVGMSSEVITLGLDEVGGENFTGVSIEKGEGGAEGGNGNTQFDSSTNNFSP